jgi:NADH:ubiquinone oxidoreductase subunit 6 (subunit J)
MFILMMVNNNYLFVKKSNFLIDNFYFFIFILFFMTFEYLITNLETIILDFVPISDIWISNIIQYFNNDILLFGEFLYLHLFYLTILISLILLVGMIGSIAICLTQNSKT